MKNFAITGFFLYFVVLYVEAAASGHKKCARIYPDLSNKGISYHNEGEWGGICNTGRRQSPINIDPKNVCSNNKSITPLKFNNWDEPQKLIVENTGFAVRAILEPSQGERPSISGGGLDGDYVLHALVFHWPNEHTINKARADLGINFVFYSDKYTCYEDAARKDGARAFVNIGFNVEQGQGTPGFDLIAKAVKQVANCSGATKETFCDGIHLRDLLGPDCTIGFYRYDGSDPVPGCEEGIIWFVLPVPGKVGTEQSEAIRRIYNEDGNLVYFSARERQPVNDRIVYHGRCENNDDESDDKNQPTTTEQNGEDCDN